MSSSTEAPNMNETQAAKEAASEGLPAASAPSAPRTDATTTTTMTPTTTTPPSLEPTEDGSDQDDAIDAEEEALFRDLEQEQAEQEKQEALHPHAPPTELTEAPLLLKKAFESGEAPLPDSDDEQEGNEASGTTGDQAGGANQATAAGAAAVPAKRAFPSRTHQLDFLLGKASQYSAFIATDLEELQASMKEEAKAVLEGGKGGGKKGSKKSSSKKRKGGDSKEAAAASAKKSKKADGSAGDEGVDAKVRAGTSTEAIFIQPPNLAPGCVLKDYQLEGIRWLASLWTNGVSGILADEMGLGKTIQCVALIAHLLTKNCSGPFIVVAPLATLPNWIREFEKWLPSHPVVRYHGSSPEREALLEGPLNPKKKRDPDYPFIVTSYEVAIRDRSKLEKIGPFTYVIVDEGHRLKNHRCTLLAALKKLKTHNRLLLTGTPIQNTLDELWSLLNFVNPHIFDDLSVFQSWFGFKDIGQKTKTATNEEAILMEERKNQTVSKLHEILRPFLLRRLKTDVLGELPPKKEVVVYSGLSKLQQGYADLIEQGTLRDVLLAQGIEDGRTLSQTNKLMNHRKNVNHPFLFGEPIDPTTGVRMGTAHPQLLVRASGKFALLDRMLERLYRDGHQVLIFSQMTSVLNVMEDYLIFRKWKYCRIDGGTHVDERQRQMDVFNAEKTSGQDGTRNKADDRHFVFLLSTRAGGLGINLTAADTCIIFDSDWNPHADSQAMDRCHRMGQTLPVAVYRLLTVNSVDIEMMEKQISKKKLERMTIAGGDFRKAGSRSRAEIKVEDQLSSLLESDIKDLNAKGTDVENIRINDEEFDMIMDRKRLFATGADAIPAEGKMYDLIEAASRDMLANMQKAT